MKTLKVLFLVLILLTPIIIQAQVPPMPPATAAEIRAGVVSYKAITPASLVAAGVIVTNGAMVLSNVPAAIINGTVPVTNTFQINSSAGIPIVSQANENALNMISYQDDQSAETPAFFDYWNSAGAGNVTESYILTALTNMANAGLTNYYHRIWYVVDAGWSTNIPPYYDTNFWPDGPHSFTDVAHSFGFKILLYWEGGNTVESAGRPVGLTNYEAFASNSVSWGFDGPKFDQVGSQTVAMSVTNYQKAYAAFSRYHTNSPVCLISFCPNNTNEVVMNGIPPNSEILFGADWNALANGYTNGIWTNLCMQVVSPTRMHQNFVRPGRWSGLFYPVPNYAINSIAQSEYGVYAVCNMPLGASAISGISTLQWQNITNSELIAVKNDSSWNRYFYPFQTTTNLALARTLADGSVACQILNSQTNLASHVILNFTSLGIMDGQLCAVRDLWTHTTIGYYSNSFTTDIPGMAGQTLRITPLSKVYLAQNYNPTVTNATALTVSGTTATELGANQLNAGLYLDVVASTTNSGQAFDRGPYGLVGNYGTSEVWTNEPTYGPGFMANTFNGGVGIDFGTNLLGFNTNQFTFSLSYQAPTIGTPSGQFGIETNGANKAALLNINNNGSVYFYLNDSAFLSYATNLDDGLRHNLTVTYNGARANMFVDGLPVATATASGAAILSGTNHLGFFGSAGVFYHGRIWNRALSTNEVYKAVFDEFPTVTASSNPVFDTGFMYANTNQNFSSGIQSQVVFNVVEADNNSICSLSTNTFLVKKNGKYTINFSAAPNLSSGYVKVFCTITSPTGVRTNQVYLPAPSTVVPTTIAMNYPGVMMTNGEYVQWYMIYSASSTAPYTNTWDHVRAGIQMTSY